MAEVHPVSSAINVDCMSILISLVFMGVPYQLMGVSCASSS